MDLKAATLKALEIASRQHADARSDTLTTLLLMLLGEVQTKSLTDSTCFAYQRLGGRISGDVLRQAYTFARLCSNEAFALVFALLSYDATPEQLAMKEQTLPVLLAGLNRLFWRDAVRCEFAFASVYDGLLRIIRRLSSTGSFDKARPLVEMACRFFLAYRAPGDFAAFLRQAAEPAAASLAASAVASSLARDTSSTKDVLRAIGPLGAEGDEVAGAAGSGSGGGAFPRPGLPSPMMAGPAASVTAVASLAARAAADAAVELPAASGGSAATSSGDAASRALRAVAADGVAFEDSAVAPLPLSPSSRSDVACTPVLPLFVREVSNMLLTMRSEAAVLRWLEMLPALRLSRRIGADIDQHCSSGTTSHQSHTSSAASDSEASADDAVHGAAAKILAAPAVLRSASTSSEASAAAPSPRSGSESAAASAPAGSHPPVDLLLDSHSAARLLTALDALATPGGPLYPTATVRRAARRATAVIFPDGHSARRSVQVCFRLLHPVAILKSAICAPLRWCQRSPNRPTASGAAGASGGNASVSEAGGRHEGSRPVVAAEAFGGGGASLLRAAATGAALKLD